MYSDATWYGGRPRPRRLCVLWEPIYLQKKGHSHPHRIFGPCLLWPNSRMDEDATWYGSRPRPRPHYIVLEGSQLSVKGAQQPPSFRLMSIVATVSHLSYCRALAQTPNNNINVTSIYLLTICLGITLFWSRGFGFNGLI